MYTITVDTTKSTSWAFKGQLTNETFNCESAALDRVYHLHTMFKGYVTYDPKTKAFTIYAE